MIEKRNGHYIRKTKKKYIKGKYKVQWYAKLAKLKKNNIGLVSPNKENFNLIDQDNDLLDLVDQNSGLLEELEWKKLELFELDEKWSWVN